MSLSNLARCLPRASGVPVPAAVARDAASPAGVAGTLLAPPRLLATVAQAMALKVLVGREAVVPPQHRPACIPGAAGPSSDGWQRAHSGSSSDGPAQDRADSSHRPPARPWCDGGQSHTRARHRLAAAQLATQREA